MSTAMLKAYANPLRRRILSIFGKQRFRRAADIAAELGEQANKISFHLRVLAEAGLLVEAPEQARDRRDRVWRLAEIGSLSVASEGSPAADPVLAQAVVRGMVADHQQLLERFLKVVPDHIAGGANTHHGTFSIRHLALTPDEFTAMMERVEQVMAEAEEAHDPEATDTRIYDIEIVAADDTL